MGRSHPSERAASRTHKKPGPAVEGKGKPLVVYSASCPCCKYNVYTRDLLKGKLTFTCTCSCTWTMAEQYGKKA